MNQNEIMFTAFGTLLGDSTMHTLTQMNMRHTDKQMEYCLWKKELFDNSGLRTNYYLIKDVETNYGTFNYHRVSVWLPTSKNLKGLYLEKGKRAWKEKSIKKVVLRQITPLGLLLWYLDDGSLSVKKTNKGGISRQATIAIHGFDMDSKMNIVKGLQEYWGINTKLHKDGASHRLYFPATEFQKFIDIVRPYIHLVPKSMRYKLCMRYEVNRLKQSSELVEKFNVCNESSQNLICDCVRK